ncbi:hypothetical protein TTHERM_00194380 (macronuclear) [Tetrahymena thermophila SB210]|uniref:Uncharacterized protein n=1 Tax=Tetrahymena thermophila (strain SB210) TaxID=312017 RepID=Q23K97_TETTS|nr:hypothetical protein TTHERM_00194380 [Tetrahymena thermophila SB210]EAR96946.2 hypothetical protein TTHERM_00194380 [Tetrahymena thermophila SB210]|eukprot:XP_001017191.2 hypothetical protein TTHERM_00194380 [Tetrahymena thermophila SB210]
MQFDYKRLLPYFPRFMRTYYEENLYLLQRDIKQLASFGRIGAKTIFIILTFSYFDQNYFKFGNINMKTPNIISRIHPIHISFPVYDAPLPKEFDEFEEYRDFIQKLNYSIKGSTINLALKYQDDPKQEEGRLVDEFLFDNEYIRVRDLSRFQALKQMQVLGFKEIKNENELNMRKTQLKNFKAKIKPCAE